MSDRYVLQVGRWGMYVHDRLQNKDIDTEQVCALLNQKEENKNDEG